MTELMKPLQIPDQREYVKTSERKIIVEAPDTTALLIDFLSEVLALSQINKEIYGRMTFSHFSPTKVEATLGGVMAEKFDEDIKAVTYHEADVRQNEKGEWETMIVFDIQLRNTKDYEYTKNEEKDFYCLTDFGEIAASNK